MNYIFFTAQDFFFQFLLESQVVLPIFSDNQVECSYIITSLLQYISSNPLPTFIFLSILVEDSYCNYTSKHIMEIRKFVETLNLFLIL